MSTTGEIRIADQALQNASGLTVINNNTGNNVAMNASLNVNLVIGRHDLLTWHGRPARAAIAERR